MTGMCYTVAAKTNTDGAFCFSDASRSQLHITRYGQSAPYVLDLRPAVRLGNDRQAHRGRFVMGPNPQGVLKELINARDRVRKLTGFDLFTSPRFSEQLVCGLCDVEPSKKRSSRCDGTTIGGSRVELKHSNATYSNGRNYHQRYFRWERLQGRSKIGKQADVYVFVGYDSEVDGTDCLSFFVIPAWVIGKKYSIEVGLDNISSAHKLLEYEVDVANLKESIEFHAKASGKLRQAFGE